MQTLERREMNTDDAVAMRVEGRFYRGMGFGLLFSLLFWVPLGLAVHSLF
jgi:hypothetical protein